MEETLTASQLSRLIPIQVALRKLKGLRGEPPHLEVARRWIREGAPLPDGSRVKLKAVRISGCLLTLDEWIEQFEQARARAALAARRPPLAEPAPRTRRASKRAADAYLERIGVKA